MTLNPSIITTSIPAHFSSQETTAFATGQTMPRKANPAEGDTFQSQKSATLKKAKVTKQPADDKKKLLLMTGFGTLIVSGGLLLAWLWATHGKSNPLENKNASGSLTHQATNGGGNSWASAGSIGIEGTGQPITATQLHTELESQLKTIKANAEEWFEQQKQAVDKLKNKPLDTLQTNIEEYLTQLKNDFDRDRNRVIKEYQGNRNGFNEKTEAIQEQINKTVCDDTALQALSLEIEHYVTQALKTICGTQTQNPPIPRFPNNDIIPSRFNHEKIVANNSLNRLDENIMEVRKDFNEQLANFYYTFSANISAFQVETVLLTTPPRLKANLTEKIQQLIEQSEAYKLHKALYESIYPPST